MRSHRRFEWVVIVGLSAIATVLVPSRPVAAHCDGVDGPVAEAARAALAEGDASRALIWVRKSDEAEIRRAFEQAVSVRKLAPQAREVADLYFIEALVRVHRAGEGAPYTGLKPAGRDLGPAIPAADEALASGDVAPLANMIVEKVRAGLLERYKAVTTTKTYDPRDVGAGREYVAAYVAYIHYAEALYEAAAAHASGHRPEGASAPHEDH